MGAMTDTSPIQDELARGMFKTVVRDGQDDVVAVEEPLEIRVDGRALAVTMRTPGHDEELALGFLHGEGLIESAREAGPPADLAVNTVEVAGPLLRERIVPLHPNVLCVSGRLSFELVQKAAVAGAPLLVGVGAPTSLAVKLADDRGLTLCGFARGGRVNVYCYSSRVV